MKALILTEINHIELQEIPAPTPTSGQVLVRISAAALNRRDEWARIGMYPGMTYNCVLGADACGTVIELGANVSSEWQNKEVVFNPNRNWGDNPETQSNTYNVLGMPSNGTFSEFMVIDADRLHLKPTFLTHEQAAALPLAGLTAFRAVFRRGNIQKGDKMLVTGIGGGVAQMVAQMAQAAGASVYVTSGDDKKLDFMKNLGVLGVNYKTQNWHKELLEFPEIAQNNGFDVIIDSAGGDDFNLLLRSLRPAGTLVFYGATLGSPQKLDMPRIFFGQYTIKGSTMGNDDEFVEMLTFVEKHKIIPIIDSVRPFSEIISAFEDMRNGKVFGKLVVSMV